MLQYRTFVINVGIVKKPYLSTVRIRRKGPWSRILVLTAEVEHLPDVVHGRTLEIRDGVVHGAFYGRVRDDEVQDDVRGGVHGGEVHDEARDGVHGEVHGEVRGGVHGEVRGGVHGEVRGAVRDDVVLDMVHDEVLRGEAHCGVRGEAHDGVRGENRDGETRICSGDHGVEVPSEMVDRAQQNSRNGDFEDDLVHNGSSLFQSSSSNRCSISNSTAG